MPEALFQPPPSMPPLSEPALRERAIAGRSRSQALCRPLVSQPDLQRILAELRLPPLTASVAGLGELVALAAVARIVREDVRMLGAALAALGSLPPVERAAALGA